MEEKIADMKPSKSDINAVILDYLISEGYPTAAERFAQETNILQTEVLDIQSVKERVGIRNAIISGQIEKAIQLINGVSAEILDSNSLLHFHLLQLQLIEIIRTILASNDNPNSSSFRPALEFATIQLAPRAPTDQKYLSALEKTMALMIFSQDKMVPEMKELLDLGLREKVADEVNRALLEAQGRAPEARIRKLIRARAWAEGQAKEARIDLPVDLSIGLNGEKISNNDVDVMVA